jgi:hypothetical protein
MAASTPELTPGSEMRCLWIRAGLNGHAYFADLPVPLIHAALAAHDSSGTRAGGERSPPIPAISIAFRRATGGESLDFHPAPRRQFIILLSGMLEFECSDGSLRRAGPGDVVLVDDTTGLGHRSREVDGPICNLTVQIPTDFDLTTWFASAGDIALQR